MVVELNIGNAGDVTVAPNLVYVIPLVEVKNSILPLDAILVYFNQIGTKLVALAATVLV